MNSTNSLPLDQYIPVNYSKGMLAVPTFVERFKQTHVKVSSILRNEGTLQKALISDNEHHHKILFSEHAYVSL